MVRALVYHRQSKGCRSSHSIFSPFVPAPEQDCFHVISDEVVVIGPR